MGTSSPVACWTNLLSELPHYGVLRKIFVAACISLSSPRVFQQREIDSAIKLNDMNGLEINGFLLCFVKQPQIMKSGLFF